MPTPADGQPRPPIVVVEDDESVLEVLTIYLERRGYAVMGTGDPLSALKTAATLKDEIWLIDMKLPFMSGLTLAEKVSEKGTARLLVIMSGFPDDNLPARVSRLPKAKFLRKPIGFAELNALLEAPAA